MHDTNEMIIKFKMTLRDMKIPELVVSTIINQFTANALKDGWIMRNKSVCSSIKASDILYAAFFWGDTDQGSLYWCDLGDEIFRMERSVIDGTEYQLGKAIQDIYGRQPLFITKNVLHNFNILD